MLKNLAENNHFFGSPYASGTQVGRLDLFLKNQENAKRSARFLSWGTGQILKNTCGSTDGVKVSSDICSNRVTTA